MVKDQSIQWNKTLNEFEQDKHLTVMSMEVTMQRNPEDFCDDVTLS